MKHWVLVPFFIFYFILLTDNDPRMKIILKLYCTVIHILLPYKYFSCFSEGPSRIFQYPNISSMMSSENIWPQNKKKARIPFTFTRGSRITVSRIWLRSMHTFSFSIWVENDVVSRRNMVEPENDASVQKTRTLLKAYHKPYQLFLTR